MQKVVALIAKSKRISPQTITRDSNLEELKMDSLDGLNLCFELEEVFDLSIPDDRARSFRSVGQIVDEIERLVSEKSLKPLSGARDDA